MTDDIVKRADEALEGVTEGPWYADADGGITHPGSGGPVVREGAMLLLSVEDQEFIAAARTLVPELREEVVRLRAVIARQRREIENARTALCGWASNMQRAAANLETHND